jgi:hypothetical protein
MVANEEGGGFSLGRAIWNANVHGKKKRNIASVFPAQRQKKQ